MANMHMIKNMDMERFFKIKLQFLIKIKNFIQVIPGQMVENMKDFGFMVSNMEKENIFKLTAL